MKIQNLKKFKSQHKKKKNQIFYIVKKINNLKKIDILIDNFLKAENSFVFESVEKGKLRGRYTIFGRDPDKIWEFNNGKSFIIDENKKRKRINGKPKNIIDNLINNFTFLTPKSLPPICSLISGYFSYDTIRYIEKIPNSCKDDLKVPDVRLLRPRELIIHDNLKKKIFYIVNVFGDEKIISYKEKHHQLKTRLLDLEKISIKSSTAPKIKKIKEKIFIKSNINKKKFISNINKAKEYIKIGDIFQVVLSQRFETKLKKKPIEVYKYLRVSNPSPFMFYFNFKDFQIIGTSPEILVRLRNGLITIRPIAGTRPRGKSKKQDDLLKKELLNDKKELSEHLMLLDLGRNDAGKVSKINSVKVTEQFKIEKYSHVMHIVSNVTGKFNNKFTSYETLMSGFPAGTVSGAPKIRAMEIIDELENSKRKIYAGGIGYFSSNGDFDTCIALRTAITKKNKFFIQAGAGIVADSIPEREFNETLNKAKALLKSVE